VACLLGIQLRLLPFSMKEFIIDKNTAIKLIKFLQKVARNLPESELYRALRKKKIKVNGKRVTDSKLELSVGDVVELYINDEFFESVIRENLWEKVADDLVVIYEDDNILIVDKPSGILCHEDDRENVNTILNKAKKHCNSNDIALCHRLDRNTRGLIILAKNALALREMTLIIRNRYLKKYYICEIEGDIADGEWHTKHAYLVRDLDKKRVYIYDKPRMNSKEIITKYRRVAPGKLEIELVTGRTHQIRAHLAYLGYPLIGDTKYGKAKGKARQHLIASKIVFLDIPKEMELEYLSNKEFALKL